MPLARRAAHEVCSRTRRCAASKCCRAPRRRLRRRRARSPDRATPRGPRRARRQRFNSATVRSSTPAASPRHPACATPTALPRRSAKSTGRQSAVSTAQTTPRSRVTAASATAGVAVALRAMDGDVGAVNLAQPARRARAERQQPAAILGDGFVRVAYACAKIHRRERARADAAAARRHERVHAGRRGPVGHDPVEARGGDPLRERSGGRRGHADDGRRAKRVEQRGEIRRQRRMPLARPAGDRVDEPEARGVQRLPRERDGAALSVRGIADERMAERGEMHADLMRAARLEPAREQRRDAEALDDFVVRARRLAGRDDRHRRAPRRMAADRRIDGAAARDVARGERQVLALHGARRELAHERRLRGDRLRDDEEPARVLVEAMDDARARDGRELRARGAAARSAACRRGCRRRDARRVPPACRPRSARRPRRRSRARWPPARARFRRRRARSARRRARRPTPCASASTTRSSSVTRPASIHARRRLREYCGSARASAASKRLSGGVGRERASASRVSASRADVGSGSARALAGRIGGGPRGSVIIGALL